MEKLQLYTLTTYKNGVDVQKSLKQNKLLTFAPPELDENATPKQKKCGESGQIIPSSMSSY